MLCLSFIRRKTFHEFQKTKLKTNKAIIFLVFSSIFHQIMTATVETVAEQLDLAAIMPAEKVTTAIARSVTLTEADTGKDSIE